MMNFTTDQSFSVTKRSVKRQQFPLLLHSVKHYYGAIRWLTQSNDDSGSICFTHFLVYIKSPSPISASIVVPSIRERVEADSLSKPILLNKPTIPGQKPFESSGLRLEADKPLLSG